jgi:alpha-tubulin suppressor-like RCC1 family protein
MISARVQAALRRIFLAAVVVGGGAAGSLAVTASAASPGPRSLRSLNAAPAAPVLPGPSGDIWGKPGSASGRSGSPTHAAPSVVSGIPNPVVQVVATNTNYYALDDTGAVWAWGAAGNGELGAGPTHARFSTVPEQVRFPAGVTIASLTNTMPRATGMAIDTDGNVWGWGNDASKQLCTTAKNINTPIKVSLPDVTLASGAGDHALYESDGTLYACGTNGAGDLGDRSRMPSVTPVPVVGLPSGNITELVTSYHNSGVLMDDGTFYDWGLDNHGQLGDGRTTDSMRPIQVGLPAPVTQVSEGGGEATDGQTIVILSDGSVWTWGSDTFGQLGDGATMDAVRPVAADVPSGVTFTAVDSGGASEYAIDSKGAAWAWGDNHVGQLGVGQTDSETHDLPISLGGTFTQISSTASNVYGR